MNIALFEIAVELSATISFKYLFSKFINELVHTLLFLYYHTLEQYFSCGYFHDFFPYGRLKCSRNHKVTTFYFSHQKNL